MEKTKLSFLLNIFLRIMAVTLPFAVITIITAGVNRVEYFKFSIFAPGGIYLAIFFFLEEKKINKKVWDSLAIPLIVALIVIIYFILTKPSLQYLDKIEIWQKETTMFIFIFLFALSFLLSILTTIKRQANLNFYLVVLCFSSLFVGIITYLFYGYDKPKEIWVASLEIVTITGYSSIFLVYFLSKIWELLFLFKKEEEISAEVENNLLLEEEG